jgi:hypothetical protein
MLSHLGFEVITISFKAMACLFQRQTITPLKIKSNFYAGGHQHSRGNPSSEDQEISVSFP